MRLAKLIAPQGDKILVLPKKEATATQSGIITKTNEKSAKKPQMGEVLAVSEYLGNAWYRPIPDREIPVSFVSPESKTSGVAAGDIILFPEYAGDDIEIKDLETNEMVTVKILAIEHVLGIVTDPVL